MFKAQLAKKSIFCQVIISFKQISTKLNKSTPARACLYVPGINCFQFLSFKIIIFQNLEFNIFFIFFNKLMMKKNSPKYLIQKLIV